MTEWSYLTPSSKTVAITLQGSMMPILSSVCSALYAKGGLNSAEYPVFSEFDIEFLLQRGLHVDVSQDTESFLFKLFRYSGNRLLLPNVYADHPSMALTEHLFIPSKGNRTPPKLKNARPFSAQRRLHLW